MKVFSRIKFEAICCNILIIFLASSPCQCKENIVEDLSYIFRCNFSFFLECSFLSVLQNLLGYS